MCAASVHTSALVSGLALVLSIEPRALADPVVISDAPAPAPSVTAAAAPPPAAAPGPPAPRPAFTPVPEPAFTAPPAFTPPPAFAPPPAVSAPPAADQVPPTKNQSSDPRWSDANVDHVVLVPTAETHPAGTVYFSDYDIALGQVGYAPSDRTEITLSGIPPLGGKNPIGAVDLSVKGVVVRDDRFRLAAIGSVTGLVGFEDSQDFAGRIGGVATLCFDDACRSTVSGAATALLAGPALLVLDGFGAVFRTSRLVAILAEVDSALPVSREGGRFHGVGGAFGVRLSGRSWGVDLAFTAFATDPGSRLVPVPVIDVTFRILP